MKAMQSQQIQLHRRRFSVFSALNVKLLMLTDKNPQHWKLLIFYFNPAEPRLLVPKRTGLPFTLNFAKPSAWVITATILVIVIVLAVYNNLFSH